MKSRALLVLGMHRSGTSAVARGLQALSVDLGDSFLDAQPENPTGYWEDRGIVDINERLLKRLGRTWDDPSLISPRELRGIRIRLSQIAAARYVRRTFSGKPLWGFKDPRTIRLLPFWRGVLGGCDAEDAYVVAIRNPRSVAASLFRRQSMELSTAQRLWLVHMVPFLRELRGKPAIVVDYDLLMREPRRELERIAHALHLPIRETNSREIDRFAEGFLDKNLRHSIFSPQDVPRNTAEGNLSHDAYLLLYQRAGDASGSDESFWNDWARIERGVEALNRA